MKASLLLRLREKVILSQFHPEIQEEVVGDNQVDAGVQGERLGRPAGVHTVPWSSVETFLLLQHHSTIGAASV